MVRHLKDRQNFNQAKARERKLECTVVGQVSKQGQVSTNVSHRNQIIVIAKRFSEIRESLFENPL